MMINSSLLNAPAGNELETVVSDLEGTLFSTLAWEGMRDYLIAEGEEEVYKRFFMRKMPRYALFKIGLISRQSMKANWILDQLRLFKGRSAEQMAEMGKFVVENCLWPERRERVVVELLAHRQEGRRVIVITGQFDPIVAALLRRMDGVEGIGTPLLYKEGLFSGEVAAPLNVGERKAAQLEPFLQNGRLHAAYGDTAADLPMLHLAHNPVAVYPDQDLRKQADRQGWRILEGTGA